MFYAINGFADKSRFAVPRSALRTAVLAQQIYIENVCPFESVTARLVWKKNHFVALQRVETKKICTVNTINPSLGDVY